MLQFYAQQIARLAQDALPVPGKNTFLSRNLSKLQGVVFLGLHLWALVSYSDGEIVSRRQNRNIDHSNDFGRA